MAANAVSRILRLLHSPRVRQYLSALAALLAYGGWTLWVSWPEGLAGALRLAAIHGSYAALLTLMSATLMELSFRWFSRSARLRPHRRGLSFGFCNLFAFSVAATINLMAGNPSIALTIWPGMLIGTVFTASYLHLLALAASKVVNSSH